MQSIIIIGKKVPRWHYPDILTKGATTCYTCRTSQTLGAKDFIKGKVPSNSLVVLLLKEGTGSGILKFFSLVDVSWASVKMGLTLCFALFRQMHIVSDLIILRSVSDDNSLTSRPSVGLSMWTVVCAYFLFLGCSSFPFSFFLAKMYQYTQCLCFLPSSVISHLLKEIDGDMGGCHAVNSMDIGTPP